MPTWRRNLIVLVLVQLLSTAGFSLVFPFLPLYVNEIGIATRGSVEFWAGMVFSSQAVTMMISAPIWGTVADRYGRKLMLARATLGGAVLLALMGLVQNAEQLVLLRTIQGGVTGVVAAANALVAAQTPRERSGAALGMLNMARWAGVALGPIIGGVLGDAFGFRESFWITGALLGFAGICVVFWVHEEFTPPAKEERTGFWASYHMLIRAPGMSGLYALTFLRSLGQTLILPIVALFVMELMQTDQGAASATGIIIGMAAFTGALSAVWLGRLGDRVGHTRVLIGAAVTTVLFYIPQPFVHTAWQLALLQGMSGFAAGGLIPSIAALMNLWTPGDNQGATYGLENSVNAAARIFSPMLAAGVAVWFGYRGVFGLSGLIYGAIAVLAVAVGRRAHAREEERLGNAVCAPGD